MPHYSGPDEVHNSFRPLTPMLLLLAADTEVVVVDSPVQGAVAAIKHTAAARGGEILRLISFPIISFTTNSTHDRHRNNNFNNNTTISAGNRYTVNGLITALEARLTTGPMRSGTRRNLLLPLMHQWGVSLDVEGAAD